MVDIRKIITMRERILSELGVAASPPVVRAVGMAVIHNPFAGRFVDDLRSFGGGPVMANPRSVGRAGPDQYRTRRSMQINRGTVSTYAPMGAHAIERFHRGAPGNAVWSSSQRTAAGGRRIRTCMGLLLSSSCFWFIASSLFGAGKPLFVPSPAIRFAERAEGVKGPKR